MINRFLMAMLFLNAICMAVGVHLGDMWMAFLGAFGAAACLIGLLSDYLSEFSFRLIGPLPPSETAGQSYRVALWPVNRMAYLAGKRWFFGLVIFDEPSRKRPPLDEEAK